MSDEAGRAAALLMALAKEGATPEQARAAVRASGLKARLLVEPEPASGKHHYDLLLDVDGGVLSVGFVPDDGTPFPLRGAQKWSDALLLRVNGRALRVSSAMVVLDFIWGERAILDELITRGLLLDWSERLAIEVSDEEVEAALDRWRLERGLAVAADAEAFLERAGIPLLKLEQMLRDEEAGKKLRAAIAKDEDFDAWLAKERAKARVEWFWGSD